MSPDPIERKDIQSVLEARQELGAQMEPALVDSFADKIIAEVGRRTQEQGEMEKSQQQATKGQLTLAIVSLVMAIPLTGIAVSVGSWMAVVCWIGIVALNLSYAWQSRKHC